MMTTNENPLEKLANQGQPPQPVASPDPEVNAWFLENAVNQNQQPQPGASSGSAHADEGRESIPSEASPQKISREKRKISPLEQILLPVALVIGILFDRLIFAPIANDAESSFFRLNGLFWLCYLTAFYAFFWKKLVQNRILWYIAGCGAALCVWNFLFFEDNVEYCILTFLVIPSVLMAHAQFAAGSYKLKDAGKIALAWLSGWVIKPFSGLPAYFGAIASLFSGGKSSTARKAALGVGITLPLLCVIVPLLADADKVFGFYLMRIVGDFNIGTLVGHCVAIVIAFALFYSFLWNVGFGPKEKDTEKPAVQIDAVICCIVLGSVTLLYVLFCAVQFTYLFAGAGLPADMTYSEYAREGFAQTVAVCAINLFIFGILLQYGNKHRAVTGFLAALLGLTGIMLFSGFMRLRLYIDAYGLTWLRLLSAWFIIYLAAVIIICAVRMVREKLPAIALCALILLGWYTALGYANPNAFVTRYNQVKIETYPHPVLDTSTTS